VSETELLPVANFRCFAKCVYVWGGYQALEGVNWGISVAVTCVPWCRRALYALCVVLHAPIIGGL